MQIKLNVAGAPHSSRWSSVLTVLFAILVTSLLAPVASFAQELTWTQRMVNGPSARLGHAMAYDSARRVTVLFGGYTTDASPNSETWEWNGTEWTQRMVSGPSGRYLHSMAYDAARGVTVLFGGFTSPFQITSETWEWNGTVWTQREVQGPSERSHAAMAYDTARGVTVLYGGNGPLGYKSDTWEWNGTIWTERVVNGHGQKYGHSMVYDSARGVCVVFGGFNVSTNVYSPGTWEWNGALWTQIEGIGPSPRAVHASAYDSARRVTVLFGGGDFFFSGTTPFQSDSWEWNGLNWTQRLISGPSGRLYHSMAYDSARGVTVLFGGASFNSETWELTGPCPAPTITTQPLDQTTSPDAPVTFFVEATSGPGCIIPQPLTYQWQRRNPAIIDPNEQGAWINLSDGNGFTNTRTSALLITRPTLSLATGYRCLISGGCRCATGAPPITYTDTVNFSVACPADFNADGGIDGADVEAFFERWVAGC
jgi:hypothetical protein